MSGSISYIAQQGDPEPVAVEGVVVVPEPPGSDIGPFFVSFIGPSGFGLAVAEDVLTISEERNGVIIGTATITGYGGTYIPQQDGQFEYEGNAHSVTITGEFDAYPCFTPGTLIETMTGHVAVEDLTEGDLAILASGGCAKVVWLGHRRARDARVIRFRPHALGAEMPRRDLCVSHDHAMLVDGVLVPAALLVNGETIVEECWPTVTFYHVELATHGILSAEGAPAESYVDTGNRSQFGNCPLTYDTSQPGGETCAEMVVAGERLEKALASIARSCISTIPELSATSGRCRDR